MRALGDLDRTLSGSHFLAATILGEGISSRRALRTSCNERGRHGGARPCCCGLIPRSTRTTNLPLFVSPEDGTTDGPQADLVRYRPVGDLVEHLVVGADGYGALRNERPRMLHRVVDDAGSHGRDHVSMWHVRTCLGSSFSRPANHRPNVFESQPREANYERLPAFIQAAESFLARVGAESQWRRDSRPPGSTLPAPGPPSP